MLALHPRARYYLFTILMLVVMTLAACSSSDQGQSPPQSQSQSSTDESSGTSSPSNTDESSGTSSSSYTDESTGTSSPPSTDESAGTSSSPSTDQSSGSSSTSTTDESSGASPSSGTDESTGTSSPSNTDQSSGSSSSSNTDESTGTSPPSTDESSSTSSDEDTDTQTKPDAVAGDIISASESVFTLNPLTQEPVSGVKSWEVLYQSENATGMTITVSGTVLVPDTPWLDGDRPIIGYAAATRGLGDSCAPSYTLTQGTDFEAGYINDALDKGWAVAISDYEGLGTPGLHTYMVGPSQGRAVLDMVRAAQRLPEANLSVNAPVGLMGYSQGGAAAGWASELYASYAPDLNIVAAAIGGVPGDLEATSESADESLFVAFVLMAASGLDAAYDELDLESYLNEKGRESLETTEQACLLSVDGFVNLFDNALSSIDEYTVVNPLDTEVWKIRLAEQKLGSVKPVFPVFQYHGTVDAIVPYAQAKQLRQDWCDLGATVDWRPILMAGHLIGHLRGEALAIDWMEERFAGTAAQNDCP